MYTSPDVYKRQGYPFLKPTLAASEAALAEQIANDPQNIRSFIATKGIVEGLSLIHILMANLSEILPNRLSCSGSMPRARIMKFS